MDKLLWAARRGDIALVRLASAHRTVVRATELERTVRLNLMRRRDGVGLPPGLLESAAAAKVLGIRQEHVLKLAATHKLKVAARGAPRSGRAALGFDRREVLRVKAERARAAKLRVCVR
jgi:hypothetical protein